MIRPVGAPSYNVGFLYGTRRARSGPETGALSQQLSALERRRRLRIQQEQIQGGGNGQQAIPPYAIRSRPPS
jgi:hypothetical protein